MRLSEENAEFPGRPGIKTALQPKWPIKTFFYLKMAAAGKHVATCSKELRCFHFLCKKKKEKRKKF